MTISVVVPSIPPRARLLARALASVAAQRRLPDEIVVEIDHAGVGASRTRDRGLRAATSEWVAFLDDDDELLPSHLEKLEAFAEETGADMVFPWFECVGGIDPFPQHFGKPWSLDRPTQTTITFLVRRRAALDIGGFRDDGPTEEDLDGHVAGEDFRFVCRLATAGYKIEHLAERTWRWHHWVKDGRVGNTSGMPWRERVSA